MLGKYATLIGMAVCLGGYYVGMGDAKSSEISASTEKLDCLSMTKSCQNLKNCDYLLRTIPPNSPAYIKNIVSSQIAFCKALWPNVTVAEWPPLWQARCASVCVRIKMGDGCTGKCGPFPP